MHDNGYGNKNVNNGKIININHNNNNGSKIDIILVK